MTPKFHFDLVQGSHQWHRLRSYNFTASNLGPFAVEPLRVTLTVDELKAELDALGIERKGLTKRDDLLAKLPNPEKYLTICDGAKTAIRNQIKSEKFQAKKDAEQAANDAGELYKITRLEDIVLRREEEMQAKSEREFGFNIPVKYGKELEPYARALYEQITGFKVKECGFIEHESGGFGCSPDGLIYQDISSPPWIDPHGVEIKCPIFETHMEWLENGTLPECHIIQVHTCLAVTGWDRWDFFSFYPGEPDFLITVYRSDFTDRLEHGLKTLVTEKNKRAEWLGKLNSKIAATGSQGNDHE